MRPGFIASKALIPPSINMIIYGALTDTSIPKLYLAGIVPGLLLTLFFMGIILTACLLNPSLGGDRIRYSWKERIATLGDLAPPLLIFLVIIVSIYGGFAPPRSRQHWASSRRWR